ncbi:MAG: SufD family Fe-S cluster assembly protein [Candidatus Nezhaarchaeota archaeon]|nr:SufD family Fe-S cluster assembly protein [Candidatus Nezhaarchaeota archaeon]
MSSRKDDALRALSKPAPFGLDLDLGQYLRQGGGLEPSLALRSEDVLSRAREVGVLLSQEERAGTYLQVDHSVLLKAVREAFENEVEVMSTKEALEKYEWLKDYWWRAVRADLDKYTALAELAWDQGYFVRVLEGAKVSLPLQACLMLATDRLNQNPHNVVIAEPGSEAQIITGCTLHRGVQRGLHVGVTELYVKEGAKLTFTMIHGWAEGFDARPRSSAIVERGATFISNYVCLKPVRSLQMYPTAYCVGQGARARFNSIIYGVASSHIDVGSRIVLEGEDCRGEIVSRAIATGRAQVHVRGSLEGVRSSVRGHLECRGLLLSSEATIYAYPELKAMAQGAELSHEAAIGKIAEEQVQYLMARGFSRSEAEALIVRGFMDVSILGLPGELEEGLRKVVDAVLTQAP